MGLTPSLIENCNCYLSHKQREKRQREQDREREINRLRTIELERQEELLEKEIRIQKLEEKISRINGIRTENEQINTKLYKYSKENDILLIPLVNDYEMDNLYPIRDEVEKWNTFIVGNDKTYIMARNKDFLKEKDVLNNKGIKMDRRIFEFLDRIWDITLKGEQIQIFAYMYSTLYLLNSYSFKNKRGEIIGACCFLREAGLIDKNAFQSKDDYDETIRESIINRDNYNNNNNNNNNKLEVENINIIVEEDNSKLNTNDENITE